MATVPNPATLVAAQKLTAARWNADVRDAVNFFRARPFAALRQTVSQTITNITFTSVTFTTEDADTDGGHSTSTNTSRYTAQTAGWYLVTARPDFVGNVTGSRVTRLAVNGTPLAGSSSGLAGSVSGPTVTRPVLLGVGDYVEMQVWQNSGGNLALDNTSADEHGSTMDVLWIHT